MDAHETDEDHFYFDYYDKDALEPIIATQNKIRLEQNERIKINGFRY